MPLTLLTISGIGYASYEFGFFEKKDYHVMGMEYINDNKMDKAIKSLERSGKDGNSESYFVLYKMNKTNEKGMSYLEKAAMMGHLEASYIGKDVDKK